MKRFCLLIAAMMLMSITQVLSQDLQIEKDNTPPQVNPDGSPPEYVAHDKEPVVVKQVMPVWPDSAKTAGLEGTVIIKVWVTKDGKVRKAVVINSDAQIFNAAAITAVEQWVFTPALQQNKPIDMWVAIPFKFKLKDAPKKL
jgi:periplasmic protein TonB